MYVLQLSVVRSLFKRQRLSPLYDLHLIRVNLVVFQLRFSWNLLSLQLEK